MKPNITEKHIKLGYQTPDKYFENSKKEMLDFVLNEKDESNITKPLWKKFSGVAAILLIAVITRVLINHYHTSSVKDLINYDTLFIESILVEDENFDIWFEENFILSDY